MRGETRRGRTHVYLHGHRDDDLQRGDLGCVQRDEHELHERVEHAALQHHVHDVLAASPGGRIEVADARDDERRRDHVDA